MSKVVWLVEWLASRGSWHPVEHVTMFRRNDAAAEMVFWQQENPSDTYRVSAYVRREPKAKKKARRK